MAAEYVVEYTDDAGDPESPDPATYLSRGGTARVTYDSGDVYEGSYSADLLKDGKGTYTFAPPGPADDADDADALSPSVYSGDYIAGQRCGQGAMTYSDGSEYRGQWVGGLRHGDGAMTYANADIYSGTWSKDVRHGDGTYLFAASDARLAGEWEDGELTIGDFVAADGTSFQGFFVQNKPSGEGVYRLASSRLAHTGEYIEGRIKIADGEDKSEIKWLGGRTFEEENYAAVELLSAETIAAKELRESAREKFRQIDKNGNGVISADEIPELAEWVAQSFGGKMDKDKLQKKLLSRNDANEDGVMDIEEFTAWFASITAGIERYQKREEMRSTGKSKSGKK